MTVTAVGFYVAFASNSLHIKTMKLTSIFKKAA